MDEHVKLSLDTYHDFQNHRHENLKENHLKRLVRRMFTADNDTSSYVSPGSDEKTKVLHVYIKKSQLDQLLKTALPNLKYKIDFDEVEFTLEVDK